MLLLLLGKHPLTTGLHIFESLGKEAFIPKGSHLMLFWILMILSQIRSEQLNTLLEVIWLTSNQNWGLFHSNSKFLVRTTLILCTLLAQLRVATQYSELSKALHCCYSIYKEPQINDILPWCGIKQTSLIGTSLLWYNLEILPGPPYFNYCIICPFKIDNLMVGDWVLLIHSK